MRNPVVSLTAVGVSYGSKSVLRNLEGSAYPTDVVHIVGKNGVGKSTLIRLLARLTRPTTGVVALTGARGQRAQVSVAFDEPGLYPHLTGFQNLDALTNTRLPKSIRSAQASEVFLGDEVLSRRMRLASYGQRKKTSILAASLVPADIYLFDEPLLGLDHDGRLGFANVVRRLAESGAVVFVTTQENDLLPFEPTRVWQISDSGSSSAAFVPPQESLTLTVLVPLEYPDTSGLIESGFEQIADTAEFRFQGSRLEARRAFDSVLRNVSLEKALKVAIHLTSPGR